MRPFQNLHLIPSAAAAGVNGTQATNVHTIALQVPKRDLTVGGHDPTDPKAQDSVIGVYASASRQRSKVWDDNNGWQWHGPFRHVSRLANPLFNEVIVPMAMKDRWNRVDPTDDNQFAQFVLNPELARLLPVLYPGVFPHLAAYNKPRADLAAILLTGIPAGVVPGFQNFTGTRQADLLRLNLAIPPSANPNPLGLVAGDPAGFPNGRRLLDDVVTVELRAVAGLTIPLVDPSFSPGRGGVAHPGRHGATTGKQQSPGLPQHLPVRPAARWRLPDDSGNDVAMTAAPTRPHPENLHAGQGPVVLDIGGDVGGGPPVARWRRRSPPRGPNDMEHSAPRTARRPVRALRARRRPGPADSPDIWR